MSRPMGDTIFDSVMCVSDVTAAAEINLAAFKSKKFEKGFMKYFSVRCNKVCPCDPEGTYTPS